MANQMLAEVEKALKTAPVEDRLALPDVIVTTAACLGVAIVGAIPGYLFLGTNFALYLLLMVAVMGVGIYVARKSPVSAPLALGYSLLLGVLMGAFTHAAVGQGGNVALIAQAVLGTFAGAVGVLLVYATPFGRKASKGGKLFVGVMIGYFVISLANVVAVMMGVGGGWGFYGVGPLGLLLCALGVAIAAWSLLRDVGMADEAIRTGAPRSWSWSLGMALASSIVWLYMEILRLLSILNR
ncbi:MAG TPA: Bax inhibitor-1/YccA family protein [Candidatus Nanopelagicales bacterium]|nr:Bax inhibitor-1/YccA family protein [Candidatus Nanopelagicales bacterium]